MTHVSASRHSASVQIIGIHVGGTSTHKTALVRGRCLVKEIQSGLSDATLHQSISTRLQSTFRGIPIAAAGRHFETDSASQLNSPLFWEAFSSELGPVPHTDADTHLMQTLSDLGGAQVFCLDAPITFPSCTSCHRACPGVPLCPEPAVQSLFRLWEKDKEEDERKTRMPLPHTERYFEAYARRHFERSLFAGSLDIENTLSSNKAPLSARAHHLARRIRQAFPGAIVVETHPWLSAAGWSLHCGYRINHMSELRQPESGQASRAGLLKKLEIHRTALRSAAFMEDLFVELSEHVEIFAASMAVLSAWGLLNGLCDIQPSFVEQGQEDPLLGWALVPRELATYGWSH